MADENKPKSIKEPTSPESSSSDSVIPDEILEAFPEEEREEVSRVIRQTMISGVMRRGNPLSDKITSDHITSLIDKSDKADIRDRAERNHDKVFTLSLILIALAFIVFLIVYLQTNQELLIKIIIGLFSFLGGYGFGKSRNTNH